MNADSRKLADQQSLCRVEAFCWASLGTAWPWRASSWRSCPHRRVLLTHSVAHRTGVIQLLGLGWIWMEQTRHRSIIHLKSIGMSDLVRIWCGYTPLNPWRQLNPTQTGSLTVVDPGGCEKALFLYGRDPQPVGSWMKWPIGCDQELWPMLASLIAILPFNALEPLGPSGDGDSWDDWQRVRPHRRSFTSLFLGDLSFTSVRFRTCLLMVSIVIKGVPVAMFRAELFRF